MFWLLLGNISLPVLVAGPGGVSILPPGGALRVQPCWEVPLSSHQGAPECQNRSSTAVGTAGPRPSPHRPRLLLPHRSVILAVGVGGRSQWESRYFQMLFHPAFPLTHSLALWQPDRKMGRFEFTVHQSGGPKPGVQGAERALLVPLLWKGRVLSPQLEISSPF